MEHGKTERVLCEAENGRKDIAPPSDEAPPQPPSYAYVCGLAVLYAVCSSMLSIVNKAALMALPFPGIVTACQFGSTAGVVFVLGKLGVLRVEPLVRDKLVQMAPINVVFYLAIFTNGKVLQYSTVETFIAFRSLTPLLVCALDTFTRGEPRPSARTMATLLAIAGGAASYAYDDVNFSVRAYSWACVYLVIIVAEMVYAKHVSSTINLSTWGLVLYQNTIALILFPIAAVVSGEFGAVLQLVSVSGASLTPEENALPALPSVASFAPTLLASCVLAVGISFAAWGTRSNISATQFTVLGVACKLATVAINVLVWQHHAPLYAQFSIIICILSSVLYQQSARRDKELRSPPRQQAK